MQNNRSKACVWIALALLLLSPARPAGSAGRGPGPGAICGYDPRGAEEAGHTHRLNALRGRDRIAAMGEPRIEAVDGTAVIEDDGSLVIPPGKFDLKNRSILFTPDGDGFRIEKADIKFTADLGFRLTYFYDAGNELGGANNGYRDVALYLAQFPFQGVSYSNIFIGTNGYITFNRPDTSASPSVAAFADELPRIAPLWADLDLTDRGTIYYNRLDGRHLVTWDGVPEALYGGASTFQLVLYDDGRIAFVYKKVKARTALAGISTGRADPARPLDLSDPDGGAVTGSFYEIFSRQKRLDIPALTRAFYRAYPDSFDAVYIWTDFGFDNGPGYARSFNVRNDIQGIGLTVFDRGATFGSPSRLATVISMGDIARNWPADPDTRVVGLYSATSIMCHELGHRWLLYVRFDADHDIKDDLLGRERAHWNFLADSRVNPEGSVSSTMEGNAWRDNGNGTFTSVESRADYFSELDQYLMGLRAADEVGPIAYLDVAADVKEKLRVGTPTANFTLSAVRKTTTVAQIAEREGPRLPDAANAPREFRIAFILLTESGSAPSGSTVATLKRYRESLERYFSVATNRRASLDGTIHEDTQRDTKK